MKNDKFSLMEIELIYKAFDLINKELFDNQLPGVFITLQTKKNALGYFHPNRFINREDTSLAVDEISLNPELFYDRPDKGIFSTLAHEMVHLWQDKFGEHKPNNGYHNREWGMMMEKIGLIPSNTAQEGGKKTGKKMSHYIEEGGLYSAFFDNNKDLLKFNWNIYTPPPEVKERKITPKYKYACPQCSEEIDSKTENLLLVCGKCIKPFQFISSNVKKKK